MSIFNTRNSDGASGLAEPTSTIPLKTVRKLQAEAKRHSCDTVAELITAPSTGGAHRGEYSPSKAGTN